MHESKNLSDESWLTGSQKNVHYPVPHHLMLIIGQVFNGKYSEWALKLGKNRSYSVLNKQSKRLQAPLRCFCCRYYSIPVGFIEI